MMVYSTKKLFTYVLVSQMMKTEKYIMHISKGFGITMYLGETSFIMQLLIMYNTEYAISFLDR